jgi:hypothetical protein
MKGGSLLRVSLLRSSCVLPLVLALFALPSHATVFTGALGPVSANFTGLTEDWTVAWGADGYQPGTANGIGAVDPRDLRALFSSRTTYLTPASYGRSVWFSGLDRNWSHADVYDAGAVDPTTITDASKFPYTRGFIIASVGDTVFFRGGYQNWPVGSGLGNGAIGYYGAWTIDSIAYVPVAPPYTYVGPNPQDFRLSEITGRYYYQSDGSGNFTAIPEPSAALVFVVGLLVSVIAECAGFAGWRRRRP